jgi:hypothetical protein
MRVLIVHDDGQLRRIESAIAAIEARLPPERNRATSLLAALEAEKQELLRHNTRRQRPKLAMA